MGAMSVLAPAARPSSMFHAAPIVFVVDDDTSVRESLELLIQTAGWQAETFASAREFLARPRPLVPSCLVLDVSLPDLNGLDLQKRIGADRSDLPIIFITAQENATIRPRLLREGAVECLVKPFSETALLTALNTALRVA